MKLKAPRHLGPAGRELWLELQRAYGIDDAGGLELLNIAAECRDRMANAQRAITEHGELIKMASGVLKANPAINIEKDARTGLLAALRQLNLDVEPLKNVGRPGRAQGVTRAN